VVDEIQDIVEEAVTVKRASSSFGLLGSGVVGGKITDFVDLGALLEAATRERSEAFSSPPAKGSTVLVVDASKIARGVLCGYLEMQGHRVLEAATRETALELLSRNPVQAVIAASSLGPSTAASLLDAMRDREGTAAVPFAVPFLLLHDGADGEVDVPSQGPQFDEVVARSDRDGVLRAIQRLIAAPRELSAAGGRK
jgi:two-component system chemotaxis sensor kinase CheA